jgi:hypothetical protein
MKEVPQPEPIAERKVIPFAQEGVNYMIYEGIDGLTHIDLDWREPQPNLRILEADRENPAGHENRLYHLFNDRPEE